MQDSSSSCFEWMIMIASTEPSGALKSGLNSSIFIMDYGQVCESLRI